VTGPKKAVVIFEDSVTIRELLRFFFTKRGYAAQVYVDGTDAVARVREHSPSLIMMDLMMPDCDGFQACAEIRRAGIATPIVVLTSKADAADRARALAAGANAYLVKPFRPGEIEATIEPLLRP
jgi:twitching motility two-component system response regulator PilG